MIDKIIELDSRLLLAINGLSNPILDQFMFWLSHKWIWIPLYLIILIAIFRELGAKKTVILILGVALMITVSDQLSVHLFKNQFERLRPCHNPNLKDYIILLNGKCGGQFGFFSSHASNTMALVIFLVTVFRHSWRTWVFPLIIWSMLVGLSRVYLGVHFPTDVAAGWLFGGAIGYVFATLFKRKVLPQLL